MKKILFSLTLLLIILFYGAVPAGANSVEMKVVPGLNGLYQPHLPVYLNISIINNGPDIENGLLVVKEYHQDIAGRWHDRTTTIYQRPVEVLAKQNLKTALIIPGDMLRHAAHEPIGREERTVVYLLAGDVVVSQAEIQGLPATGEMLAAGVGENLLSGGLTAWLSSEQDMMAFKTVPLTGIPVNPLALNAVSCLVIDHLEAGKLSVAQSQAIRQWVALGGNLILSKGAGTGVGQPFAAISPVLPEKQVMLGGDWQGLRSGTAPLEITKGQLVKGEILLAYQAIPLVASYSLGHGQVIYSAVDLGQLNLQDRKVWQTLFDFKTYGQGHRDDRSHAMIQNSGYLPQIEMPSVGMVIGIWLGYMLVVTAGLYFLLKHYRRHDWAWLGIPVVAVMTLLIIYGIAPFHQLKGPLGNTIASVVILDHDVAEVQAGGTYVSPRGDDLFLNNAGQGLVERRFRGWQDQAMIVEQNDQGSQIQFKDVEFWSLRQASAYKVRGDLGQITGQLQLSGDKLIGTLTNNTSIDLSHCLLIVDNNMFEIDNLPAGAVLDIEQYLADIKFMTDQELGKWAGMRAGEKSGYFEEGQPFRDGMVEATHEFLHEFLVSRDFWEEERTRMQVRFKGRAEQLPGLMNLKNDLAVDYTQALVTQKLSLAWEQSGAFKLPAGFIAAIAHRGLFHTATPKGLVFKGQQVAFEFNLKLPQQHRVTIETVELVCLAGDEPIPLTEDYRIKVYDWTNNRWVNLEKGQNYLTAAELSKFLLTGGIHDHQIRFQLQHRDENATLTIMPGLAVEGVIK
ncbi:MAG: hypothetical protein LRZ99_05700 [Desulfotomaculum sp.]|nr:hypothetical protein [Desulfotomaculum sp.]